MNKPIKILLLVIATFMAVGGVMAYYKTIVSPPGKLVFKNQYVDSAKKDIAKIKSYKHAAVLDSSFISTIDELDLQLANNLLSGQERDELFESFATQYVPAYVSYCNFQFNKSVWDESELRRMQKRITDLCNLVTTDQRVIIQGEAKKSLDKVDGIIDNYYKAKDAASASGYYGLQSARDRIATAAHYASMSPINNCTELLHSLNSVASRLEQAHYSYLASQVERLRYYYNYTQDEYDNLAISIANKIEEYKKNAKGTYGYISDMGTLENRASTYYSNASFDDNNDFAL